MNNSRDGLLKRISNAFLPQPIALKLLNTVFFKVGDTPVNGWTLMHLVSGLALRRYTRFTMNDAQWIHVYWEVFQFIAGDNKFDMETVVDITLDTLAYTIGYTMG